jgi:predicted Zn-dependent peptidase
MDVHQGHLVIGYRTAASFGDPDWPALLFANGVLGGFTHSKLFQNVRERASLAYFVYSNLEQTKGVLWISAGIDFADADRTLDIVGRQLEDMRSGHISEEEMENTRKALLREIAVMSDDLGSEVDFELLNLVNACRRTPSQLARDIAAVTRDDVVRASHGIALDTVYFLRGDGEGGGARA